MTYSLTAAVLLSSVLCMGGTELVSGGKTLFKASGNVTFGATYTDRAVKATVSSVAPVTVTIRTDKKPNNVFVGEERLTQDGWSYDDENGTVTLAIKGGSTDLQLRFDDLQSLKPVEISVPVFVAAEGRRPEKVGIMAVTVASEQAQGNLEWQAGSGFYRVSVLDEGAPVQDASVSVQGAMEEGEALLQKGSVLRFSAPAPGQKLAVDRIVAREISEINQTVRVPKDELDWAGSVVVEGEAFSKEGGGSVKKSTDHQNTHGGGCIFTWANPGHWIEWEIPVIEAGDYMLTVIIASGEDTVLRSADMDGSPIPGAAVLSFEGTGGWGRSNPAEWQPCRPVSEGDNPLSLTLSSGTHTLRMNNLLGQHMNVDVILLTPVK